MLKLICRIVETAEASAYIFWYHDNRMINYDVDRGINVSTDAGNLIANNFQDIYIYNGAIHDVCVRGEIKEKYHECESICRSHVFVCINMCVA